MCFLSRTVSPEPLSDEGSGVEFRALCWIMAQGYDDLFLRARSLNVKAQGWVEGPVFVVEGCMGRSKMGQYDGW